MNWYGRLPSRPIAKAGVAAMAAGACAAAAADADAAAAAANAPYIACEWGGIGGGATSPLSVLLCVVVVVVMIIHGRERACVRAYGRPFRWTINETIFKNKYRWRERSH